MKRAKLLNLEAAIRQYYSLEAGYLRKRSHKAHLVKGRHVFFYIAYTGGFGTSNEIGRFACRDHASVLHGYKKIKDLMSIYLELARQVEEISKMTGSVPRTDLHILIDTLKEDQVKRVRTYIKALIDADNRGKNAKIQTVSITEFRPQVQAVS